MQNHKYTPYYCEENIYLLTQQLLQNKYEDIVQNYVVIVSNAFKQVYLKQQRNSKDGLVVWDYHVVLIQKTTSKKEGKIMTSSVVYDFDSLLPWGCPFEQYFKTAIDFKKPHASLQTMFKVCDGNVFIKNFASNRSHMMKNNKYLQQPPDYPLIRGELSQVDHNLDVFWDTSVELYGKWLSETQLFNYFQSRTI